MSMIHLNAESYQTLIQESDKPVLVEFSAPWCGYCRRLAFAMEATAKERQDTLVVGQINIDDEPALAEAEGIELIPTLLLYQKGELLGSVVNPQSKARLDSFITDSLR